MPGNGEDKIVGAGAVTSVEISRAIRQGKWLDILYLNRKGEKTHFLFAVHDINIENKILRGNCCNPYLAGFTDPVKKGIRIDFNRFISANVIEDISYDVPPSLIKKLENCTAEQDWLRFNEIDNNIFLFLEKCVQYDPDPAVRKFEMLEGIDADSFAKNGTAAITEKQALLLAKEICSWQKDLRSENRLLRMAFNELSVKQGNANFPIVYREVELDLDGPSLRLGRKMQFSKSYLLAKSRCSSGEDTIDFSPEEFIKEYEKNREECIEEIRENLRPGCAINTNPEFMQLMSGFNVHFQQVRIAAMEMIRTKMLPDPVKAYLGMNTVHVGARRSAAIVTYDSRTNIDQVRAVFNAMRENITYVEGPPGTGKTQTILNVIFSLFFAGKTCLVCSNNNLPIDGIIRKLTLDLPECRGKKILFPFLRIGNNDVIIQTIRNIRSLYEQAVSIKPPDDAIIRKQHDSVREINRAIGEALQSYEQEILLREKADSLKNWMMSSRENTSFSAYLGRHVRELENKLSGMRKVTNETIQQLCINGSENPGFINFLYYSSVMRLQKLKRTEYRAFTDILNEENMEKAAKAFRKYIANDGNVSLLLKVFPIWFSTNISAEKIGSPAPVFDMCIMDEAGQCDIARSLIPMIRAERLLMCGDTKQLAPIILLDEKKHRFLHEKYAISKPQIYDYTHNSIMSLMMSADCISKRILLSYHYRCAADIIRFSNEYYYKKLLRLENKSRGGVFFADVHNVKGSRRNSYYEEAASVVSLIKTGRFDGQNIAIVTPFNNQAWLINAMLEKENIKNAKAGTIHKVQGQEYDTVILSTAIADSTRKKTFDWVKNSHELINVAVTRAKKNFAVVADKQAINTHSGGKTNSMKELIAYASGLQNGTIVKIQGLESGKDLSNGSEYERQFFRTLSQVLSTTGKMIIKRNVPMRDVFLNTGNIFPEYYALSEFDIVLYNRNQDSLMPVMAIEVDGGEHYINRHSLENDRKKELLCRQHGIKLFRVPNAFASHYSFIKEYIASMPESPGQLELFNTASYGASVVSDIGSNAEKTEERNKKYSMVSEENASLNESGEEHSVSQPDNTPDETKARDMAGQIPMEHVSVITENSGKKEKQDSSIFTKGLNAIKSLFGKK